ncbi:cysteine hydrolase family protein [uncultured Leifsonia sp.]|uniref:cysteine hydrolase family protein n=1 Tax=uncultured Leifsonia sp. TaxID=340359 RepID=UPI0025DFADD2|nr:cysteine hydrolase family protein [uncultured Leifsonia sp.]
MKRALIVIDVQNEYVTGNLKICHPDLMTSIPNIEVAMDAAADHGVKLVLVQHIEDEGSPVFARGSDGAALHSSVADRTPDLLVTKQGVSAFAGTELNGWLRSEGVDTVTIAGYMTQHCCAGTARDAAALGFAVEFLSDATGTLDLVNPAGTISADALHVSVLVTMDSEFAAVATTEEWTLAVEAGDTLPVSNLWDSTGHARLPAKHAELHKLMRDVRAGIDREIAAGEASQFANTLYVGQGASGSL